jgi:hypothetical protein
VVVNGETRRANRCARNRSLDALWTFVTAECLSAWKPYSRSNPAFRCHAVQACCTRRLDPDPFSASQIAENIDRKGHYRFVEIAPGAFAPRVAPTAGVVSPADDVR